MLVLARKVGESIQIGDEICVTILHIGRGRVQIGIEAPRTVTIRREELADASVARPCSLPVAPAVFAAGGLEIAAV